MAEKLTRSDRMTCQKDQYFVKLREVADSIKQRIHDDVNKTNRKQYDCLVSNDDGIRPKVSHFNLTTNTTIGELKVLYSDMHYQRFLKDKGVPTSELVCRGMDPFGQRTLVLDDSETLEEVIQKKAAFGGSSGVLTGLKIELPPL